MKSAVIQGSFPHGVPRPNAVPAVQPFGARSTPPWVQARIAGTAAPVAPVQRHVGPAHPSAQHAAPQVAPFPDHGGQPLPPQVRQKMEAAFGTSFRDVRIHVGPQAQAIGATAVTQGAHIHFAPGQYDPHTHHGQQLLGRELAHVVQQRAGRVRNPSGHGVAIVQDRALEAEADRLAMRAAAYRAPAPVQRKAAGGRVVQLDNDWVGFDADRYQERDGVFTRFDTGTNGWVQALPPVRELVSQYFGAMVRATAPPDSIADFVGKHVKAVPSDGKPRPAYLTGIVGVWDTSLARTGHALGSGPSSARQNQLGDGIYVVNPGSKATDYKGLRDRSYVYDVYAMKNIAYTTRGDHEQTVFTDSTQFQYLCFVKSGELTSVAEDMEARQKPTKKDEFDHTEGGTKLHYSIF